jgi:hypothetical protein
VLEVVAEDQVEVQVALVHRELMGMVVVDIIVTIIINFFVQFMIFLVG